MRRGYILHLSGRSPAWQLTAVGWGLSSCSIHLWVKEGTSQLCCWSESRPLAWQIGLAAAVLLGWPCWPPACMSPQYRPPCHGATRTDSVSMLPCSQRGCIHGLMEVLVLVWAIPQVQVWGLALLGIPAHISTHVMTLLSTASQAALWGKLWFVNMAYTNNISLIDCGESGDQQVLLFFLNVCLWSTCWVMFPIQSRLCPTAVSQQSPAVWGNWWFGLLPIWLST